MFKKAAHLSTGNRNTNLSIFQIASHWVNKGNLRREGEKKIKKKKEKRRNYLCLLGTECSTSMSFPCSSTLPAEPKRRGKDWRAAARLPRLPAGLRSGAGQEPGAQHVTGRPPAAERPRGADTARLPALLRAGPGRAEPCRAAGPRTRAEDRKGSSTGTPELAFPAGDA